MVNEKEEVHVVIHIHRGVIYSTGVYKDPERARKEYEELVIEEYGELVESQEGEDTIDLQTCQVIV